MAFDLISNRVTGWEQGCFVVDIPEMEPQRSLPFVWDAFRHVYDTQPSMLELSVLYGYDKTNDYMRELTEKLEHLGPKKYQRRDSRGRLQVYESVEQPFLSVHDYLEKTENARAKVMQKFVAGASAIRQGARAEAVFGQLGTDAFKSLPESLLTSGEIATYVAQAESMLKPPVEDKLIAAAARLSAAGVQLERDVPIGKTLELIRKGVPAILQAISNLDPKRGPPKVLFPDIILGIKNYYLGTKRTFAENWLRYLCQPELESLKGEYVVHEALEGSPLTHEQIRLVTAVIFPENYPADKPEGLLREHIDHFVQSELEKKTQALTPDQKSMYAAAKSWGLYAGPGEKVFVGQDMESLFNTDGTPNPTRVFLLQSWLDLLIAKPEMKARHPIGLYSLSSEFPLERLRSLIGDRAEQAGIPLVADATIAPLHQKLVEAAQGFELKIHTLDTRPWKQAGLGEILFSTDDYSPKGALAELLKEHGLEGLVRPNGTMDLLDPIAKPQDMDAQKVSAELARLAA